jgi:hypothetical protein
MAFDFSTIPTWAPPRVWLFGTTYAYSPDNCGITRNDGWETYFSGKSTDIITTTRVFRGYGWGFDVRINGGLVWLPGACGTSQSSVPYIFSFCGGGGSVCKIDCSTAPDGFCCIDHSLTDRLLQQLQNS